jgi:hypothetical protein
VDNEDLNRQSPGLDDDAALLARLRRMFDHDDHPPAEAVELARQSYGLRAVDAELAALAADSDLDAAAVVVRSDDSGGGPRLISFEAADLAVEVEVTGTGRRRRLLGQLLPAGPIRVEVRHGSSPPEVRWIEVDDRGRFVIENVSAGPISLTCHRPGQRPVATQWTWLEETP